MICDTACSLSVLTKPVLTAVAAELWIIFIAWAVASGIVLGAAVLSIMLLRRTRMRCRP